MKLIQLVFESFRFAWNALKVNKLRTILSLLGVTIGIFAIIAVFTIVDSLESSIKNSFSFLGSNVLYVEKWPYGLGGEYPWWEYMKRPHVSDNEYEFLQDYVKNQQAMSMFAVRGGIVLKKDNNSVSNINLLGVDYGHSDVFDMPIINGRYFTQQEIANARSVTIIGANVAEALFPMQDPVGKEIKIKGLKYNVIGVLKEQGESMLGLPSNDDSSLVPFKNFKKLYETGGMFGISTRVAIKGLENDDGLVELESEVTGLMRGRRSLKPLEENNFALNRPESIAKAIESVFAVITIAGAVIGGFSILVGGFGIANIMFVSVKERTSIIGIQKSIGAKNYFILLQFLFESVFLSLIGGIVGMFLVYLITFISLGSFEIVLTLKNISLGLGVATVIGIIAGVIPAAVAARMDPVTAIRTQ